MQAKKKYYLANKRGENEKQTILARPSALLAIKKR